MRINILCASLAALLCAGTALAQTSAPPAPPAAPPVSTSPPPPPPAAPPVNTATPPVNTTPPPIGTPMTTGQPNTNTQQNVPRDANGNPLPSTATLQQGAQPAAPQPLDFKVLDTDKAGALKMEQATNDPWLRQHFVQCDANHNDEVTQSEYAKCTGR